MYRKMIFFGVQDSNISTPASLTLVVPNLTPSRSFTSLPISRVNRIFKLPLGPIRPLLHALILLITKHFRLGNDTGRHGLNKQIILISNDNRICTSPSRRC